MGRKLVGGDPPRSTGQGRRIDVAGLAKVYPDGTPALHEIDLHCEPAELTVILGPSGCGKTTLLRCIAGLEEVTSGLVAIDGQDVTGLDPGRRDLAMVFQNYGLYPSKTVRKNIEFPLRMAGWPRAERLAEVARIAETLQLGPYLGRRPAQLSGGQRQRVGIGRALVRRPGVLLMDEPLSNLDAELRLAMRKEIHQIQRSLGTTTLYVTHDQSEALALADRLIIMSKGRIEQTDAPEAVYGQPATEFVAGFLGGMNILPLISPGVRAACAALLSAGFAGHGPDRVGSVGVRPEDWRIVSQHEASPPGLALTGTVESADLLGRDRLLTVRVQDRAVHARVHADDPVPNVLTIAAAYEHIHLFDTHGHRLSPERSDHANRAFLGCARQ
jgi:ABC-type sugar transport system ATPase subunit